MSELDVTRLEAGIYMGSDGQRYVTEQGASQRTNVPRATLRDHGDDSRFDFTRVDRGEGTSPRYLIRESDLPRIKRARHSHSTEREPRRPVEQMFEEMRVENAALRQRVADLENLMTDLHASIEDLAEANVHLQKVAARLNKQLAKKP